MRTKKIVSFPQIIILFSIVLILLPSVFAIIISQYDYANSTSAITYYPTPYTTVFNTITTVHAEGTSCYQILSFINGSTTDILRFNRFDGLIPASQDIVFGWYWREDFAIYNSTMRVVNLIEITNNVSYYVYVMYSAFANTIQFHTSNDAGHSAYTIGLNTWYWIELKYTASTGRMAMYVNGTKITAPNTDLLTNGFDSTHYWIFGKGTGDQSYIVGDTKIDGLRMADSLEYPPSFPTSTTTTPSGTIDITQIPNNLAIKLNIPIFVAGIIATLVCLLFALLPIMIFASDNLMAYTVVGILVLGIGVGLTWLPYWIFIIIVILIALLFADVFRKYITGTH